MPPQDGSTQEDSDIQGRICCDDYIPWRTVGVKRNGVWDPGCGAGATVAGYRYPLSTFLAIPPASSVPVAIRPREAGIVLAMLMYNSGADISVTAWDDSRGKTVGIEAAEGTNGITDAWDPANFDPRILETPYNPLPPNLGPITPTVGMVLTVTNAHTADTQFFSAITWILRPKNFAKLGL